LEKLAQLIRKLDRFLITTHVFPDGDGLGAEMAMHNYLKKSGKRSTVLNLSPTPAKFQLVDPRHEIHVHTAGQPLPKVDAVIVMDTSDWKMLAHMADPVRALGVPVMFVDHHVSDIEDHDNHLIDEKYASTGELIYDFLRHLRADIDADIALAIYVSIVTDTSSFRFKRTTARSHTIAAELLQKGISPESVYQYIYARDSFAKIRLFGHVLERISASPDERMAWITIPKDIRNRYKATIEDTEAYVTQLTLMEGVEIGILFREDDDGRIKVSLRGRGEVPVIGIAKKFGGGGHRHAAGVKLSVSLDEAIRLICGEAQSFLDEFHPKTQK
jgi:phosphoesterase RecJ-like protein